MLFKTVQIVAATFLAGSAMAALPDGFQVDGAKVQPWASITKTTQKLPANPDAARLAERTERTVTVGAPESLTKDLTLVRKSITANGYTRYLYELTASTATKVERLDFFELPDADVSGNTDGAVAVLPDTFVGIEHPMAKVERLPLYTARWTEADYKALTQKVSLPKLTAGETLTVNFEYESGAKRLDIARVRLVQGDKTLATDEHEGFTGLAKSKNVYTLKVPAAVEGAALVADYKIVDGTDSRGAILVGSDRPAGVKGYLLRGYVLEPGQTWTFSVVQGGYKAGQLRRTFQNYLEFERAHPYRVFPHYNSWFHLGIKTYGNDNPLDRMTEARCLKAMTDINAELFTKRGVRLDSYLWDDGWDNWDSLWDYHEGFPQGFKALAEQAKAQESGIGVWLSPWGGYNKAKEMRVAHAKAIGLPTNAGGLSLAQEKYFRAFRDRCLQMIKDYGLNLFKFDGIGGGPFATGASPSIAPDLQGLINHIAALRKAKPDVFINCTVGTWASPFWVLHADSIWRGGSDWSATGEGNKRERWITYRDDVIFTRFAAPCPLFPLNSIMMHGIIVSDIYGMPVNDTPEATKSYANEVWMGVACGTDLQEYYVNPEMMSQKWWDILAEGIQWLRANEDTLRDTHWFGGAPAKGEVYGYASASAEKQILLIRNPSSTEKTWNGSLAEVFELPGFKPAKTNVVYATDGDKTLDLSNGITLKPFEVKVIEFTK